MVLDCSIDRGSGSYYVLCQFGCADTNRKPVHNINTKNKFPIPYKH